MTDKDIRIALIAQLRASDPDAVVYEELPLSRGEGRADCAAVNGSLYGFEIKSERDSLSRLDGQVENYEKVFDYCTVVVAQKHLRNARKRIPQKWGIWVAAESNGELAIRQIRKARKNPNTDQQSLVWLLWKREAISVLRSCGIECRSDALVSTIWPKLLQLPHSVLATEVRNALKERHYRESGSPSASCGD